MKTHKVTVALLMSKLSVSKKIIQARSFVENILANPVAFVNPNPTMTVLNSAIDDLEIAQQEAANGDRVKTALMHDKEKELMKLLTNLAHYVERVANDDENIVHLAGMEVKKASIPHHDDFEVVHAADRGAVRLRVKAAKVKTIYRWEYSLNPTADLNAWTVMKITSTSTINFGDLAEGTKYWFRVVFINNAGESTPYQPVSLIVS